jgi:hypothetical protein
MRRRDVSLYIGNSCLVLQTCARWHFQKNMAFAIDGSFEMKHVVILLPVHEVVREEHIFSLQVKREERRERERKRERMR